MLTRLAERAWYIIKEVAFGLAEGEVAVQTDRCWKCGDEIYIHFPSPFDGRHIICCHCYTKELDEYIRLIKVKHELGDWYELVTFAERAANEFSSECILETKPSPTAHN